MSALGWELNLGFAASDAGTPASSSTPVSTLLLLGTLIPLLVSILG